jgi:hypothetical protein
MTNLVLYVPGHGVVRRAAIREVLKYNHPWPWETPSGVAGNRGNGMDAVKDMVAQFRSYARGWVRGEKIFPPAEDTDPATPALGQEPNKRQPYRNPSATTRKDAVFSSSPSA